MWKYRRQLRFVTGKVKASNLAELRALRQSSSWSSDPADQRVCCDVRCGSVRASQQKAAPYVRLGSIASPRQPGSVGAMSASPPIATKHSRRSETPLRARTGLMHCSKNASLFDHLVSRHLHDQRHRKAERLGGLEIDHQLEFGRLLNRKIGWQCALRMRAIYAPASQRSISPNTMSSELMIAVMSASMCPRLKKSIACKWANEGARILHL